MNKDNSGEFNSAWLEDEQFKEFLHEYVEKDAYKPGQDEKLGFFITYKALYKIYTATLNAKDNVQKLDENLAKLNETNDHVEKELTKFELIMNEQERINKSMRFQIKFFLIATISLFLVLIYYILQCFKILS